MDWTEAAKWVLAPSGVVAGLATWFVRHRRDSGSWLSRRLAIERDLATCQQQVRSLTASNASLAAALEELAEAAEMVSKARQLGLLTPSSSAPASSPPNSSPGRTRPPERRSEPPSPSSPTDRAPATRPKGGRRHETGEP